MVEHESKWENRYGSEPSWREAMNGHGWRVFIGALLVVGILSWARAILVPIALAILLTFLLGPLVSRLQRWRLSRGLAVTAVVLLTLVSLGGAFWLATLQLRNLADSLPQYRANIRQKIGDLRDFQRGGAWEKLGHMAAEVRSELSRGTTRAAAPPPAAPVPAGPAAPFAWEQIAQPLASAGLVLLLLTYMLAQREELRNRIIRAIGYSHLSVTTHALEEMGERISRYLLTQLTINSSFGLLVALALAAIDLPYAFLWGFLSALLIFVPVIGFWLAAGLPTALSLAVFTSWVWPLAVLGLFLVLKTLINMVLEPLLYGKSAGVLQVPLLILLAFWTWLWGPVGLILATPLTVCLLVFAKHVPELELLNLLMSDQPAMTTRMHFYQRLLALDYDEAAEIVESYRREHTEHDLAAVYDALLLPALTYARADQRRGQLSERQGRFILSSAWALQEELAGEMRRAYGPSASAAPGHVSVLGIAVGGELEKRVLTLLGDLLDADKIRFEIAAADGELGGRLKKAQPRLAVLATLPPGGIARARHLCKWLRAQHADLKVVLLRSGRTDEERGRVEILAGVHADQIAATLTEARRQIDSLLEADAGGAHGRISAAPPSAAAVLVDGSP